MCIILNGERGERGEPLGRGQGSPGSEGQLSWGFSLHLGGALEERTREKGRGDFKPLPWATTGSPCLPQGTHTKDTVVVTTTGR